jgi:hypothetical protein
MMQKLRDPGLSVAGEKPVRWNLVYLRRCRSIGHPGRGLIDHTACDQITPNCWFSIHLGLMRGV